MCSTTYLVKCKFLSRRNVDMMRMLGYAKCPYPAQNSREVLYCNYKERGRVLCVLCVFSCACYYCTAHWLIRQKMSLNWGIFKKSLSFMVYIINDLKATFVSLFVCFKGSWRWYACCLTNVSVFAEFPIFLTPLCKLPCRGLLKGAGLLILSSPDLKKDCSTSFTLPQAIWSGKERYICIVFCWPTYSWFEFIASDYLLLQGTLGAPSSWITANYRNKELGGNKYEWEYFLFCLIGCF